MADVCGEKILRDLISAWAFDDFFFLCFNLSVFFAFLDALHFTFILYYPQMPPLLSTQSDYCEKLQNSCWTLQSLQNGSFAQLMIVNFHNCSGKGFTKLFMVYTYLSLRPKGTIRKSLSMVSGNLIRSHILYTNLSFHSFPHVNPLRMDSFIDI